MEYAVRIEKRRLETVYIALRKFKKSIVTSPPWSRRVTKSVQCLMKLLITQKMYFI